MASQKEVTPRYKHDCKACKFIGCLQEFDLYACPQNGNPTIVARFSSKGPDYFSGHPLHVAGLHISLSIGWLTDDQVRS